MTEPSHAVFLSYASQDAEAARRIADALRAGGVEVWFDQTELRGGDAWDRQIRKQVHDCALFIPIISAHSQERLEGYFRREWKLAVDRTHDMAEEKAFLVPVVIDGTSEREAGVPDKFRDVQWSRLPAGETSPVFVQRVQGLLSPELATTIQRPATIQPNTVATRVPRSSTPVLLMAIALPVLATTAYLAINRPWTTKSAPPPAPTTAAPPAPSNSNSIAVLPFADLSEKKDQQYFADGMAEEVLDLLAKIPGLSVIGRTSSFQFRDKAVDVRSIGSALDAAYVLEGSVRKSGEHIRVTAQLIETRDATHRWSDTFDVELTDVLKIQDAIATGIARALQLAVENRSVNRDRINPAAYDLYLKGLRSMDMVTKDGCEEAVADFQQALDLQPTFIAAASNFAKATDCLAEEGWAGDSKTAFERVRLASQKVLAMDPKNAQAHTYLALVHKIYDWDWEAASREINTAMNLGARDSFTLLGAGGVSSIQGSWDEALKLTREAVAKDPLNGIAYVSLGWNIYAHTGRYVEAEKSLRRALEIAPHYAGGHASLAVVLLMQGRPQEALSEANEELPESGQREALALVYHALHQPGKSQAFLSSAIEKDGSTWPSAIARIYAFRGEKAKSILWLNRAFEARDVDLDTMTGDPLYRSLLHDEDYLAFLRRMKLPAQ